MKLIYCFLIVLYSFQCFALPIGHESGFLGDTTSRPGDIGSALVFPSATAYIKRDEIKIYFGLMYMRQEVEVGEFGGGFENQFIPYFTGFAGDFFGLTFANYVTYSGTNNGRFNFNEAVGSDTIDGTIDIQAEQTVIGGSVAKKFEKFSLGFSANLAVESIKTFTTLKGNLAGNDFLASQKEFSKNLVINSLISGSYLERNHFFSVGLSFPEIKYSSSKESELTSLLSSGNIQEQVSHTHPRSDGDFGLNLGYSYLSLAWAPSIDIYYNLDKEFLTIRSGESVNRANFNQDTLYKIGLSSPEYVMNHFFKGTSYSFLFGFQYREVSIGEEGDGILRTNKTHQYSIGYKLINRKTSPIFGIYYENEKNETSTKVVGLMYSSNYNIFD